MTHLLWLFQIKTVRSAWIFLIGSGSMFLFGIYQLLMDVNSSLRNPGFGFSLVFFAVWFLITGIYMAVASWALWSKSGKTRFAEEDRKLAKSNRTISWLWFLKFFFACYAAGFATLILLGVLSLPFSGFQAFESVFSQHLPLYALAIGAIYAPLVYRYLK